MTKNQPNTMTAKSLLSAAHRALAWTLIVSSIAVFAQEPSVIEFESVSYEITEATTGFLNMKITPPLSRIYFVEFDIAKGTATGSLGYTKTADHWLTGSYELPPVYTPVSTGNSPLHPFPSDTVPFAPDQKAISNRVRQLPVEATIP